MSRWKAVWKPLQLETLQVVELFMTLDPVWVPAGRPADLYIVQVLIVCYLLGGNQYVCIGD